jgi:catechol 2,3-dioxygenase-like lactoylglutathione lyase family enzyme
VARLVGINHVAVEVGDLDEALAFFGRLVDELPLRGRSGNMAFVDLGDQFIALAQSDAPTTGRHVHYGLVVDDREDVLRGAREAGYHVRGNDVRDPWGNTWQVVDYRDVQFTKTPRILEGMGAPRLDKSERALGELRAKGLAD